MMMMMMIKGITHHSTFHFWGEFFSGGGPDPFTVPHPLDTYGASPLLTEILNTPLRIMLAYACF